MSSIYFSGSANKWNGSNYADRCWHITPTMFCGGYLNVERNGGTIFGSITEAYCNRPMSGSYPNPVYIVIYIDGRELTRFTSPTGGNWNQSSYWEFSYTTNSAVTVSVQYVCGESGGCTKTTYGLTNNAIWVASYNPRVDPTPATWASNNCNIAKPDESVTISWGGASGGTVGISHYQIEMSLWRNGVQYLSYDRITNYLPSYDSSITLTLTNIYNYNNETGTYGPKRIIYPGDTLMFYVVTYSNEGWIGTITASNSYNSGNVNIYKSGRVMYKDTAGTSRELVTAYSKDTNGTGHELRYIKIKDASGNSRVLDMYTFLY